MKQSNFVRLEKNNQNNKILNSGEINASSKKKKNSFVDG